MHPVNILLIFVGSAYTVVLKGVQILTNVISVGFFLQLGHPVDEKLTWKDQIKNTFN